MNSVSFFYNIFNYQEFILKLNILDFNKQFQFEKCILFKSVKNLNDNKLLQNINNDLRYILEFLTNSKINKAINDSYIFKLKIKKQKSFNLFLYFSFLIFSRSNFILESNNLEYDYPILQKSNKIINSINKDFRNYFDINFRNGLNLRFLSDNEYTSWLSSDFYIRFIFKRSIKFDFLFEIKQYLYMSLIGFKFILIKNVAS